MLEATKSGAPRRFVPPAPSRLTGAIAATVVVLCLLGLILRILAARGDLWLDEIWSFIVVGHAASFADVVLALPYDNNHVFNSLWLKLVGGQAPSLVARLPAVLFGTLCIPVAARLGARTSPLAAIVMAAVFAADMTFVQFGSEARGYAGLILAFLVALDALEARLDRPANRGVPVVFALAVAFGTFSHLTMVEATTLLCAAAAVRLILAEGWRGAWPARLAPILIAAAAGTLPAAACFTISLLSGPLHVGLATPFSFATFADGLGGMARITLGVWAAPLARSTSELLLPIVGLGVVAALPMLPPQRRVLPALGLLASPLTHAILHLPNQLYARFHLVAGVCLALLVAELSARAWRGGPLARTLALVAGVGFLAGQSVQLTRLIGEGRGSFAEATALMTGQGSTSLAVLPAVAAPETAAVMRWYANRAGDGANVTLKAVTALCTSPAAWLVVVHRPDDATDLSDAERLAATPCAGRFEPARRYPGYGMSGFAWTILRRSPP